MNKYFEDIVDIIIDVADLKKEEIHEDSFLIEDLELSSLELMALMSKIEEKYNIKIDESCIVNIETVKDIVDLIS